VTASGREDRSVAGLQIFALGGGAGCWLGAGSVPAGGWCAATRAAAVNLGVFLQLNLPRTAANRTLLVVERYQQR
jgi:hypothetical protein